MWPHFLLETHKKEGGGDDVSLFARMDRSVRFPLSSPLVGLLHWSRVNCRVLCCRRSAPASPSLPSVPSSSFLATRSPPPHFPPSAPLATSSSSMATVGRAGGGGGRRWKEWKLVARKVFLPSLLHFFLLLCFFQSSPLPPPSSSLHFRNFGGNATLPRKEAEEEFLELLSPPSCRRLHSPPVPGLLGAAHNLIRDPWRCRKSTAKTGSPAVRFPRAATLSLSFLLPNLMTVLPPLRSSGALPFPLFCQSPFPPFPSLLMGTRSRSVAKQP